MQSNEPWLVYSELNFPEHVTHINIFPANSEQQQQHQQQLQWYYKQPPFPPQKYWKQQNQTALCHSNSISSNNTRTFGIIN